jgi:hypothetical protein
MLDGEPEQLESQLRRALGPALLNLPEQFGRFVAEQRRFNGEMRQFRTEQRCFNNEGVGTWVSFGALAPVMQPPPESGHRPVYGVAAGAHTDCRRPDGNGKTADARDIAPGAIESFVSAHLIGGGQVYWHEIREREPEQDAPAPFTGQKIPMRFQPPVGEAALIRRLGLAMDPQRFPPEFFQREDESNDAEFYTMPRLVVHIDGGAIVAVGRLFQQLIPENAEVLDLMSSWRTHWPEEHPRQRIVGLGMNAAEMADNPQLSEYLLKDINIDPSLPFADGSFDAVVITVSVQYLTQPVIVFSEVSRVLRPGGVFIVTFSNRCFPTKAVRVWRSTNDEDHIELVASYMQHAGGFNGVRGGIANPDMAPPGDPLFAVFAYKETDGGDDTGG